MLIGSHGWRKSLKAPPAALCVSPALAACPVHYIPVCSPGHWLKVNLAVNISLRLFSVRWLLDYCRALDFNSSFIWGCADVSVRKGENWKTFLLIGFIDQSPINRTANRHITSRITCNFQEWWFTYWIAVDKRFVRLSLKLSSSGMLEGCLKGSDVSP